MMKITLSYAVATLALLSSVVSHRLGATTLASTDTSVASGDYEVTSYTTMSVGSSCYFGTTGTALLTIGTYGTVYSSYNFTLGQSSGSNATLNCSGNLHCYNFIAAQDSGSTATINLYSGGMYTGTAGNASLFLGQGGNATMTNYGGVVSFYDVYIADYSTSTSSLTMSGGQLTTLHTLYVGYGGNGTFNLSGGTVTSSSSLEIGSSGTGKMTQSGGSASVAYYLNIGCNSGGNGTLEMSGGTMSVTLACRIGINGTGALNMTGGTLTCSGYSTIGSEYSGAGTATISGSGTSWTNTGSLSVGSSTAGSGTLTISNGALVTADSLSIGSGGAVYINNGYLALAGDETSAIATLLGGGSKIYVYVGGSYVALTTANYTDYVIYTSNIATDYTDLATTYGLSGAYTVLTTVPEPATYALFGGLGALGMALLGRKRKTA